MKKLKLCFLILLAIFLFGKTDWVFASSYQDLFDDAASFIPNIYIAKEKDGMRRYRQMTTIERKSDGSLAYCIEADEYGNKDTVLNGVDSNQAELANLTKEEWMRISLIAYYGYGYGNHTDLKWYAVSQIMIWQTIPYGYDIFFTEGLNGKKTNKYDDEMQEIENLIQMHGIKPSFDGESYQLVLGETLQLTDTNSVLSLYEFSSSQLVGREKDMNSVTFYANAVGKETVTLTKKDKNLSNPVIVYVDPVLQDVMVRGSYEDVVASVSFEVVGGQVKVEKKDSENGASLKGAVFGIYTNDGKKLGTVATNDSGSATSMTLPSLGKYYLQEEVAPNGYKLDTKKYYFEITKDNLFPTVSIQNEKIKGQVKLVKTDSESGAGLKGAVFGIYQEDGKKIDTVTTDRNGNIENMIFLNLGKYYLQEEVAPTGYKLDDKKYYFEITKDNLFPTVSIQNEIIKGQIELTKVLASSVSGFIEVEIGAGFGIYDENGVLYTKIVTNKNGKASVTLPYGTWEFRQLSSQYNYEKVKPFKVQIKSEETQEFILSDALISSKLKIVKVDSVTGNTIHLAGISFKIRNKDTNEYVCQNITYPSVMVLCEYQTNEEGILITPYPLPIGKYELEEVDQKIDGYLWNNKKLEFEIGNDTIFKESETGEKILEVKFANTPVMGELEIFKYGEEIVNENGTFSYQETKLDGVCFALYANRDIYSSDGVLKYKKDERIKEVCAKDGYAKISNLYLGSYYFVETSTLDGFVLDSEKYYFTLDYKDQYTSIVTSSITLKNILKKGTLEFTKEDFITGDALPNTLIEVYTDLDGLIFSGRTDNDGKITIPNLGYGKYYILEKEAPAGYILNTEKLYFEILKDDEIVKVLMKNEKQEEVPKTNVISSSNLPTQILLCLSLGTIQFLILPLKRNI